MTPVDLLAVFIVAMVLGTGMSSSEEEVWYCFVCAGATTKRDMHPIEEEEDEDEDEDINADDTPTGPHGSGPRGPMR